MALNPKSLVYQGREGTGAAQVFDTTGASKWEIEKIKRLGEEDERKNEAKADARKDIAKLKFEVKKPWSEFMNVYDRGMNEWYDQKGQFEANVSSGAIEAYSDEYYEELNRLDRLEAGLNVFAESTAQAKAIHDKFSTELEMDDKETYDRYSSLENLNNFKAAGIDPNDDILTQLEKGINHFSNMKTEDILIGNNNFDYNSWASGVEDLLKDTAKKAGWYGKDGEWVVNTESMEFSRDNLKSYVATAYLSDPVARRYFNENYSDEIEGFEDMSNKDRAKAISNLNTVIDPLMPPDMIKSRGSIRSDSGFGYGVSEDGSVQGQETSLQVGTVDSTGTFEDVGDAISNVDRLGDFYELIGLSPEQWRSTKKMLIDMSSAYSYAIYVPTNRNSEFTVSPQTTTLVQGDEELLSRTDFNATFNLRADQIPINIMWKEKGSDRYLRKEQLESGDYSRADVEYEIRPITSGEYADGTGQAAFMWNDLGSIEALVDVDRMEGSVNDYINAAVAQEERRWFGNQSQQNNQQQEDSQSSSDGQLYNLNGVDYTKQELLDAGWTESDINRL